MFCQEGLSLRYRPTAGSCRGVAPDQQGTPVGLWADSAVYATQGMSADMATGQRPENRVVRPTVLPTVGCRAPGTLCLIGHPLGPYVLAISKSVRSNLDPPPTLKAMGAALK